MNSFQESLNELLVECNLSRLQLANKLNISSTTINGYFNRGYYPKIDIAIQMAKFFNCSLDFLFGLSDKRESLNRNNNSFFENLDRLIKASKVSISQTLKNLNMSEYDYYRWKKGQIPKTINLIEIAKYFNVSVESLIGSLLKN